MAVSGSVFCCLTRREALFFGREPPSAAQVGALDLRALDQLRAATGGHDLSGLHHIAPVGHGQGHLGVLLHQQDGQ